MCVEKCTATIPSKGRHPVRIFRQKLVEKKIKLVDASIPDHPIPADLDRLVVKNRDGMAGPGRDGGSR
jgi:hypothetical protein